MASTLLCKITKRKYEGNEVWEGILSLTGAKPTKLVKGGSQDSLFGTRAAVAAAARSFAKRYSLAEVKFDEPKKAGASKSTGKTRVTKKVSSTKESTPVTAFPSL